MTNKEAVLVSALKQIIAVQPRNGTSDPLGEYGRAYISRGDIARWTLKTIQDMK